MPKFIIKQKKPLIRRPFKKEEQKQEPEPPFWKWEDGLTQSFINQWLQCRETCRIRYIEGWRPRKKSPWFEFGTVFQYCLEQAFNEIQLGLKLESTREFVHNSIIKYETEVKNPLEIVTSEEIQQAELIYLLAEKLLPIYFRLRASDFNNEIIYNETEFDISHKAVRYRGKIDLGWKEKSNNSFWLLDTKCLSVIKPEIILGTLPHDIQCMLYLWAATQQNKNPKGIIYNVIRRPAHRQKNDESVDDFTTRIAEEALSKPDHFFMRFRLEISPEEVQNWFNNDIEKITDDICHWSKFPKKLSYINPNTLETKYGKSQYFDLLTKNDCSGYYQGSNPFPELSK